MKSAEIKVKESAPSAGGPAGAGSGKAMPSSKKDDDELDIVISDDCLEAALRILDRLSRDKVCCASC
jgi:hypothetical protein